MTTAFLTHTLRIGTRGSTLARWQTALVRQRLESAHRGLICSELVLTTHGDRDVQTPLPVLGGRGVFTDALEHALRGGEIDLAVHSLKDVPVDLTPGLILAAIGCREDPRDALLSAAGWTLDTLPEGAVVGTCSTRRSAQLRAHRPDLRLAPLRGNIDTRVRQVAEGRFAAIVLAAAGIARLGLTELVTQRFEPDQMLPAPGQGALAVQCRADAAATRALLAPLEEPMVRQETDAERAFLAGLGGGCTAPIAALGRARWGALHLNGLVASEDGGLRITVAGSAPPEEAVALGRKLADQALAQGAGALLP
ncbi:MAG: hydroxymethylbilane synthase [Gemmatimonadales bacterium]